MPRKSFRTTRVCVGGCVRGHAVGQLNFEVQSQYEIIRHRMCTCVHTVRHTSAYVLSCKCVCVCVKVDYLQVYVSMRAFMIALSLWQSRLLTQVCVCVCVCACGYHTHTYSGNYTCMWVVNKI